MAATSDAMAVMPFAISLSPFPGSGCLCYQQPTLTTFL